MNRDKMIEDVKKHIQTIRKNTEVFHERDFKIALGKVIIDLKEAKKTNNTILKDIFSL